MLEDIVDIQSIIVEADRNMESWGRLNHFYNEKQQ